MFWLIAILFAPILLLIGIIFFMTYGIICLVDGCRKIGGKRDKKLITKGIVCLVLLYWCIMGMIILLIYFSSAFIGIAAM